MPKSKQVPQAVSSFYAAILPNQSDAPSIVDAYYQELVPTVNRWIDKEWFKPEVPAAKRVVETTMALLMPNHHEALGHRVATRLGNTWAWGLWMSWHVLVAQIKGDIPFPTFLSGQTERFMSEILRITLIISLYERYQRLVRAGQWNPSEESKQQVGIWLKTEYGRFNTPPLEHIPAFHENNYPNRPFIFLSFFVGSRSVLQGIQAEIANCSGVYQHYSKLIGEIRQNPWHPNTIKLILTHNLTYLWHVALLSLIPYRLAYSLLRDLTSIAFRFPHLVAANAFKRDEWGYQVINGIGAGLSIGIFLGGQALLGLPFLPNPLAWMPHMILAASLPHFYLWANFILFSVGVYHFLLTQAQLDASAYATKRESSSDTIAFSNLSCAATYTPKLEGLRVQTKHADEKPLSARPAVTGKRSLSPLILY